MLNVLRRSVVTPRSCFPAVGTVPKRSFVSSVVAREATPRPSSGPSEKKPPSEVAFAFDIDGVLKLGKHVLPAAKRAMKIIRGANKYGQALPHIFLTNGGGSTEADRAKLLTRDLEETVSPDQVILSHSVMKQLVPKLGDKPVLAIGPPRSAEILRGYGFNQVFTPDDLQQWAPSSWTHSSPPDLAGEKTDFSKVSFAAVLVVHDNNDWGRSLQYIADICRSNHGVFGTMQPGIQGPHTAKDPANQIPLYIAHNDLIWNTEFGVPRNGLGSYRIAAEAIWKEVTGRQLEYTMYGKPEAITYKFADRVLSEQKGADPTVPGGRKVYMIGDNPASDIAGAVGYGWESVLVRTGVWSDAQGEPAYKPSLIADDVEQAVVSALQREWGKDAV